MSKQKQSSGSLGRRHADESESRRSPGRASLKEAVPARADTQDHKTARPWLLSEHAHTVGLHALGANLGQSVQEQRTPS